MKFQVEIKPDMDDIIILIFLLSAMVLGLLSLGLHTQERLNEESTLLFMPMTLEKLSITLIFSGLIMIPFISMWFIKIKPSEKTLEG